MTVSTKQTVTSCRHTHSGSRRSIVGLRDAGRTRSINFAIAAVFALLFSCTQSLFAEENILKSLEGPDITIIAGEERTVYEYRQNGLLRIIKIVPSFGRPYFLVPADETRGFGDLSKAQTLVPRWVIVEF